MSHNEEGTNNNTVTDNPHHVMFVLLIFFYFSLLLLHCRLDELYTVYPVPGARSRTPAGPPALTRPELDSSFSESRPFTFSSGSAARRTNRDRFIDEFTRMLYIKHLQFHIHYSACLYSVFTIYGLMWRTDVWTGEIIEFYV